MNPFSETFGPVQGEYGTGMRGQRGPLIISAIAPGGVLHILEGPPWEQDSKCVAILSATSLNGGHLVSARQSIALPEGANEAVLVSGFFLDEGDANQLEPDVEDEAKWGRWRRHLK